MPVNASHNMTEEQLSTFLGSGAFISLGREKCLIAWGKAKKAKSPTAEGIQFYLPDFYLESKSPWLVFENVAIVQTEEVVKILKVFAEQPKIDLRFTPPRIEDFQKQFDFIQAAIKKNEINKAVPVIFERANCTITKAMRASYIANLLSQPRPVTPYGFLTPTSGMIGASPEILFTYDAATSELKTMALAGTRSSELEKVDSLEKDEKEIYEHALVVKGLREKLSSMGESQVSPTYVWDIGPLCHLRTDLTIEMASKPDVPQLFHELCVLLHPTAALGVSPVSVDFRFLKKCDGDTARGRFGAPFGVMSPAGKSIALVAIRNIQWGEDGEVMLGSGCGVTERSVLKNEWNELLLKRNSVKALLGI